MYSNKKIKPSNTLSRWVAPIVFMNVRSSSEHKTLRKRQCYRCLNDIQKGDKYINHQFRYDNRIITLNFHTNCFNEFINK